jgi:adenylylsulfate kinase-like enzyme
MLWFTGLSGAGKSTLVDSVQDLCSRRGQCPSWFEFRP